jgi:hypothetical protein
LQPNRKNGQLFVGTARRRSAEFHVVLKIGMIKITLQEYEINDAEKGNYFYLRGEVADEGYAGWSDIVVAEEDLKAFFEDLNNFARDFKGMPELKTGWGDEAYFRIRFEKWRPTGTLWVDGEIATPARGKTSSDPSCSHRFIFGFPTEPGQLDAFLSDLHDVMNGDRKEAILEGTK